MIQIFNVIRGFISSLSSLSLSGAVLSARALALRAECDAAAGGDARVRSGIIDLLIY